MVFKLRRGFFLSFSLSDTPHYENVPFEVPDSWVWCRLDDLCNIKGGKRIPKGKSFATQRTEHIYLRVTNMKNRTILFDDLKYIDDAVFQEIRNYTISSDDLYLTIAGTIGDVGEIPQEVSGMNLTENAAKLTDIGCNRLYLMYSLLSTNSQEHFSSKFHQVAQPKLSIETASSTLLPLPPLAEQQRIVTEIERWFTLIDQIEQDKSDLQTVIKQAKSKILDLAIHGKLVPQNPNDEPASELLKRIYPEAEITCDNGHDEKSPFEIPDTWVWCRHNSILDISGGAQPAKSYFETIPRPNYIRLYQIRDYGESPVPIYIPISLASKQTEKGDILLARYGGSLGKVFHAEQGAYNVAMAKVIFKFDNLIYKEFAYYYYLSNLYQGKLKEISRTAQAGFNSTDFNDMYFPLPPLSEQQRIVAKIEELFSVLDNIQNALEA